MTRSPLQCCTSIIRSSALVQASSSLSIGRTCAWPRRLPVTELYFRHFSPRVCIDPNTESTLAPDAQALEKETEQVRKRHRERKRKLCAVFARQHEKQKQRSGQRERDRQRVRVCAWRTSERERKRTSDKPRLKENAKALY